MKAVYREKFIIEVTRGLDNLYHVTIDGRPTEIKPSRYGRVLIRKAIQAIEEGRIKEEEIEKP